MNILPHFNICRVLRVLYSETHHCAKQQNVINSQLKTAQPTKTAGKIMEEIKEESKCLASLAVFRELYNNEKDIYSIICEFLKEIITSQAKHQFTLTEITSLLNETYDFKIPEAVVNTSLNRFKTALIKTDGMFTVSDQTAFNITGKLTDKHNEIKTNNETIIYNLFNFIETEKKTTLTDDEKTTITHSFITFIIDETTTQIFSDYISAYILKEKQNVNFTNQLNTIKEGVVLYTGLKYNTSLNELGSWNTDLTIFLEMEILFHFAGFNGELYQLLFNDMFSLIKEINQASVKKTGKRLIQLKYFSELKNDIEGFFKKAEYIVQGKDKANPSKTAMTTIIDGCKTPADVIVKKTKFYELLKQNSIYEDDYTQYYSAQNHKYNLEDQDLLKELSKKIGVDNLQSDLKYLNYINIHRKGRNDNSFERIGYVLLTGTSNTLRLAWDENLKPNGNIPLASNLSYLTNKFWFKLNKGFGKSEHPKSFDIVTKAQIVLSTQLNDTVSDKFDEFQIKLKNGQITKEEAVSTIATLRREAKKPEDINEDNIENILSSIEESSIETYLKEQDLFKQKAKEHEAENIKLKEKIDENVIIKEKLKEDIKKKEEENEQKENQLKVYRDAEKAKKLSDYQNDQWKDFIKFKRNECYYFVAIAFLTLLPILVGIIFKSVKSLSDWVERLGTYQWCFWGGLVAITLFELFGRSYIFNKEKIKSGWMWLIINKKEKLKIKNGKLDEYKSEFERIN